MINTIKRSNEVKSNLRALLPESSGASQVPRPLTAKRLVNALLFTAKLSNWQLICKKKKKKKSLEHV